MFAWLDDKDMNPKQAAENQRGLQSTRIISVDEVRETSGAIRWGRIRHAFRPARHSVRQTAKDEDPKEDGEKPGEISLYAAEKGGWAQAHPFSTAQ